MILQALGLVFIVGCTAYFVIGAYHAVEFARDARRYREPWRDVLRSASILALIWPVFWLEEGW